MSSKVIDNSAFKRAFHTLVGILALTCLVFTILNLNQAPRLRRVEVNKSQVTQQPNERLVLYVNQPVDVIKTEQIKIEPSVNFKASSNGEAVVLQFNERLLYNTTYHITANNIASSGRKNHKSTLLYSFKTPDPTFLYLHRNHEAEVDSLFLTKKPDEIIQTSLSGSKQETIFTAEKIQDYILMKDKIIVATINDDKTNSLFLVDIQTKKSEELTLPASGTLTNLRGSPNQRLAGFSFTSNEKDYSNRKFENILFNIDLAASNLTYSIDGLNNNPLQIMDWQFAPDGTTILAQTYDTSLLLIDTNLKNKPVPLGRFSGFSGFSYNGAKIGVDDNSGGPVILDAIKHTKMVIKNSPIDGIDPYPENLLLLANSDGYIQKLDYLGHDSKTFTNYLVINQHGKEKVLYKLEAANTNLGHVGISPNDQFALLETSSTNDSKYEDYLDNSRPSNVRTLFIDTNTGKTVKDIDGFQVIWH